MINPKRIVCFSGGICSWIEAKRVVAKHGPEETILLFADTKMEDEDLYRFLDEAAKNVGAPLIKLCDGRNPWEVMRDEKVLAGHRTPACSRVLKIELMDKWIKEHCSVSDSVIHFGYDWSEHDRLERVRKIKAPWNVASYTCTEPPLLYKPQMMDALQREGIKPPRLYCLGFPHNNCGGFCVKAGQGQFALLLKRMPERYRWHEDQERRLRDELGWRQTILRDSPNGIVKPLTLREFRERVERMDAIDSQEWGGCGCGSA